MSGPALTEVEQAFIDQLVAMGWQRRAHFIDWDNLGNNTFRVINQFQVACPPGQRDKHIRPDIVRFVDGIPLVIIECKSPYAAAPLEEAVDQLQRYAIRRRGLGIVDVNEAVSRSSTTPSSSSPPAAGGQ